MKKIALALLLIAASQSNVIAKDVSSSLNIWASPACETGCSFLSSSGSAKTVFVGDVSKHYKLCRANSPYGSGSTRVEINASSVVEIPDNSSNGRGCIDVAARLITYSGSADLLVGIVPNN
jgi:hypothetical protein